MKKKIVSLNFWRFLAFFGIYLGHCTNIIPYDDKFSGLCVEFFLICSGFLMAYNYWDIFKIKAEISEVLQFTKNKIKKFYFIFLISIIIKFPATLYKYFLEFSGFNISFVINSILRFTPCLLLIQAFIPFNEYYFAYNGVAWFLDVLIFCYLLTPIIINGLNKVSINKYKYILILILVFQIIYVYVMDNYVDLKYNQFLTYILPAYRLCDYCVGLLIGAIFLNKNNLISNRCGSIREIAVIFLLVFYAILSLDKVKIFQELIAIIIIIVFSMEKGFISKKLNNRFFVYLGNLSIGLYLLHQPIIKYFEIIAKKTQNIFILYILFFIATLVIIGFSYLLNEIINKKNEKEVKL